jgi:phosphoserine phosphatase RsbU/P
MPAQQFGRLPRIARRVTFLAGMVVVRAGSVIRISAGLARACRWVRMRYTLARMHTPSSEPVATLHQADPALPPASGSQPVERVALSVLHHAQRHPFLQSVPAADLQRLIAQCRLLNFTQKEIVLQADQSNDALFLVLEGQLHAMLDAAQSAHGVVVAAGECFGEMSVIEGKPVSVTVVADAGACVLMIPGAVFWSMLANVDGVARSLLKAMSERMRQRSELVLQSLRERMEFEAVQRELRLAQEVQLSMLTDGAALLKDYPAVEAVAVMLPAKVVGGDFFDAFGVDRERVFLAVGDVAGKGFSAALFMARSLATLRLGVVSGQPHSTLIARFNDALCEHNEHSTFVTLCAGFLNTQSGELAYFSAGHHAALLISPDGAITALPRPAGMVAGAFPGAVYEQAQCRLAVGDILVAFTDGVTEAQNHAGQFFGEERLLKALVAAHPTTAAAALQAIRNALAEFTADAPQFDDITILAIRLAACGDAP